MSETTRIEYVPLDQLKKAPRNPKAHSDDIKTSIGRFGYVEPIVVDERTGCIVAGHGRREALLALGLGFAGTCAGTFFTDLALAAEEENLDVTMGKEGITSTNLQSLFARCARSHGGGDLAWTAPHHSAPRPTMLFC